MTSIGKNIISRLNMTHEEGLSQSNLSLSDIDITDYNDQIPFRFDFRSLQLSDDSSRKFTLSRGYGK
jgi:hypothetical protein